MNDRMIGVRVSFWVSGANNIWEESKYLLRHQKPCSPQLIQIKWPAVYHMPSKIIFNIPQVR